MKEEKIRKGAKIIHFILGFIVGVAITIVGECINSHFSLRRERQELVNVLRIEIEKNQGIINTKLFVDNERNSVHFIVDADPFSLGMMNFDINKPIFKTETYKSLSNRLGSLKDDLARLISRYYDEIEVLERERKRIDDVIEAESMTPPLDENLKIGYISVCKAARTLGDSILIIFEKQWPKE